MRTNQNLMYPMMGVCLFLSQASMAQTLYGSISLNDMAVSNNIKIVGVGSIQDTTFKKDVKVVGYLNSRGSRYLSNIHAIGSDVSLSGDEVEGDVHITNYLKKPKLHLENTIVKGKVIFHGRKRGVVIKDASSQLNGVENGDIE